MGGVRWVVWRCGDVMVWGVRWEAAARLTASARAKRSGWSFFCSFRYVAVSREGDTANARGLRHTHTHAHRHADTATISDSRQWTEGWGVRWERSMGCWLWVWSAAARCSPLQEGEEVRVQRRLLGDAACHAVERGGGGEQITAVPAHRTHAKRRLGARRGSRRRSSWVRRQWRLRGGRGGGAAEQGTASGCLAAAADEGRTLEPLLGCTRSYRTTREAAESSHGWMKGPQPPPPPAPRSVSAVRWS